jgi:hypothetical protein
MPCPYITAAGSNYLYSNELTRSVRFSGYEPSRSEKILPRENEPAMIAQMTAKVESSATTDQTWNDVASLPAPQTSEEQVQSVFDEAGATPFQGKTPDEQMAEVRAERIRQIKAIEPKEYQANIEIEKTEGEKIFTEFGIVKNTQGTDTLFPVGAVSKILSQRGFPAGTIISNFAELYREALYAYSEKERVQAPHPDGTPHKKHPNFEGYHNFVNKFAVKESGGNERKEYYIRFTIQEEKASRKAPNRVRNFLHSSFISGVELYEANGDTISTGIIDPGESVRTPTDNRLQQFFDSVNPSD